LPSWTLERRVSFVRLLRPMYVDVGEGVRVPAATLFGRRLRCRVRAMAVQVTAHITGTVWKIEVKLGDTVANEQTLVILESMKMEMPVEAPTSGRVSRIAVSEGQSVEEGDLLIELDE
jgi:acetyl-CoA carboxylase biotin carboxyl carrier protein